MTVHDVTHSWFFLCSVNPARWHLTSSCLVHIIEPFNALYPLHLVMQLNNDKHCMQHINVSAAAAAACRCRRSLLKWNAGCMACSRKHVLDDMNNLADTKGGNINAHIYSNLSERCVPRRLRLSLMWKSSRLIQKCILASELFTYRCMIMIPRLICDKSCCLAERWR